MLPDALGVKVDLEAAQRIFTLIDESHLSIGRAEIFGVTGETNDGKLAESDCRGCARMMRLDEEMFWRLLRKYDGDARVDFNEWLAAIKKIFCFNRIRDKGPTDIDAAIQEALDDMSKDNWRGKCTIKWKGGAPGLHHKTWKPIIEKWDCFDVGKSSSTLVYTGGGNAEVRVEGLNEHCPSNRRSDTCTWPELQATLLYENVDEVYIVDTSY